MKQKILKLIKELEASLNPRVKEILEDGDFYDCHGGNFDDAVELGIRIGSNGATEEIILKLEEILNETN